uniref:Uncharacterized protein LOC117347717 isoform X2 n=1 Tax=Geotrypetes seraphini TaxID=260995 RepID=A0A6P8P1M9_GEOSA|nr:uncharacterized protein LOC117347717 isoform X2 [Geotrypetes seraphini]
MLLLVTLGKSRNLPIAPEFSARTVALDKFSVPEKEQKFETSAKQILGSSLDMLHSLIPRLERPRPEAPTGREAAPVVIEERGIVAELIKYKEQRRGRNTMLHLLRLHSMKSTQDHARRRGGQSRVRIQARPDFEDEDLQLMMPVKPKSRSGKKAAGKRKSTPPQNAYGPVFNRSPAQNQPMTYSPTGISQEIEGSGITNRESSSDNESMQTSKGCKANSVNKIVTHSATDKGLNSGHLLNEMLPSTAMKESLVSSPTSPTYESISITSPLKSKSTLSHLTLPSTAVKELNYSLPSSGTPTDIIQENDNATTETAPCRPGYVLEKERCRSICDLTPNYCQNGGKCIVLQDVGPLCMCIQSSNVWYKGERCESFLTEFQLNCIIVACCLLLFILLLLLLVLVLKTSGRKLSRPLLGSTSKLWISSLAPQMSQSFSTLSEASDVTEQTSFGSLPRLSTFFDTERNRPLPLAQKQSLIVCEEFSSTSDFHARLLPDYHTKVPTDPSFWMMERTAF